MIPYVIATIYIHKTNCNNEKLTSLKLKYLYGHNICKSESSVTPCTCIQIRRLQKI